MKVCGEVIKIKNGIAHVRTARPASCEGCSNAGLCSRESVDITAINGIGAEVGDFVEVEADEGRSALWVAAYIFLVPVAILFLGAFLFSIDPWFVAICLPVSVLYFVFLKVFNSRWKPVNRITEVKDKQKP